MKYTFKKDVFKEKLKKLINASEYSREEFAEKIELSVDTLNSYCQGKSTPSAENIMNIALGLGISVEELLLNDECECQKKKKTITNVEDITPEGIIESVNYLVSAYGDNIIETGYFEKEIDVPTYEDGYPSHNPETIKVPFVKLTVNGDEILTDYLSSLKKRYPMLKELEEQGDGDVGEKLIKKYINLSDVTFDGLFREMTRENISDLPF